MMVLWNSSHSKFSMKPQKGILRTKHWPRRHQYRTSARNGMFYAASFSSRTFEFGRVLSHWPKSWRNHSSPHPITFGAYVRRIVIPVDMTGVWQKSLEASARQILLACPNTQILSRRKESFKARYTRQCNSIRRAIDDIQMPRLRRVDWNNAPADHHQYDSPASEAPVLCSPLQLA